MLHASLRADARISHLRKEWNTHRSIRIEPFLEEATAIELLEHLRAQPFSFRAAEPSRFNFQYWELETAPHSECQHPTCTVARWWWSEGAGWLSDLTGMKLGAPPGDILVSTLYDKGCYLDPHSDSDGSRQLAFVLGLTREAMSLDDGGHLEFLGVDDGVVRVHERRLASWNSLDIFDVRDQGLVHRVSLVTKPSERRALSGWFWRP